MGRILKKILLLKRIKHLKHLGLCIRIEPTTKIVGERNIIINDYVSIEGECVISGKGGINIGEGTIIAHRTQILSTNHDYDSDCLAYIPFDNNEKERAVEIGKYVWIGTGVIILPGVKIGDYCVIGAGSVVTKNIPPGTVACGNPAKVVKMRSNIELVKKLESDGKSFIKCCRKSNINIPPSKNFVESE